MPCSIDTDKDGKVSVDEFAAAYNDYVTITSRVKQEKALDAANHGDVREDDEEEEEEEEEEEQESEEDEEAAGEEDRQTERLSQADL